MARKKKTESTHRGEAGRRGDDVRSDLYVTFESGGNDVVIDLQSRVATYYGRNIEAQARRVLTALGVLSGRLSIEDKGALPFVIAARIEAAVRRAGLGQGLTALPSAEVSLPEPSPRDRLRRSRLYLPGSEPKFFVNAALHGPDAVILDLEDSVHPAEKDTARILVRNALKAVDFGRAERMVRINQLPLGLEDLDEVIPLAPDMILIPKVERAEEVEEVDVRIAQIEGRVRLKRPIWLMPILESARGIENAFAIASETKRVAALTIGLEDYTADLGVVKTPEGDESLYARTRLVNAAHAAGAQAIDSVYGDVGDVEGLLRWAKKSRALGFEGMGCIHPRQIPLIHEAFAPSPEELEKALRIVAAYEEAQSRGLGVVSLGTKMIDPPVVHRAAKLVGMAKAMGLVPQESRSGEKEKAR